MTESAHRFEPIVTEGFAALFQAIPAPLGELSQNMRLQSSSRVEVLTTGDELIEGTWRDLHSQTIAHSVSDSGGMIYRFNTVGDHLGELVTTLNDLKSGTCKKRNIHRKHGVLRTTYNFMPVHSGKNLKQVLHYQHHWDYQYLYHR